MGVAFYNPPAKRWSFMLYSRNGKDKLQAVARRDGLPSEGAAKRDLIYAMQRRDASPNASSWGTE